VATLEAATNRYMLALVGDLRSDQTIRTYETLLGVFRRWLSERLGRAPTVADLTLDNARAFASHLRAAGRSRKTQYDYLSVLRVWGAFLARTYRWAENPLADLKPERPHARPVDTFSEAEVGRMVDAINRTKLSYRLRNRAAIFLLLDTGMRVSELCALELDDVTWPARQEAGSLSIRHGKGDKPRRVAFSPKAARELELYVEDERPDLAAKAVPPCPRLFLGADGREWTRQGVRKLVAFLGLKAGVVGKRVSPHTFRSTFATEALVANNSLPRVQDALGHANANQTMHYVSLAELRKTPFVSPLERWRNVK
jgi:site-specific recombinase XerD